MSRIGVFSFVGRGHLDPAGALAACLNARGHKVTIFHLAIAEAAVRRFGVGFRAIDDAGVDRGLSSPGWRRAFTWSATLDAMAAHAASIFRNAPKAIAEVDVDGLVVDQSDVAVGTIAELLGIPYVTLSCAPPFFLDAAAPSTFFPWCHSRNVIALARNAMGNWIVAACASPLLNQINQQRRKWRLPRLQNLNELFSTRGIVTQLPEALDFTRSGEGPPIYYVGPIRHDQPSTTAFPWHRLDGRPLIYASLGTVRNTRLDLFATIVEALDTSKRQAVLSLGGGQILPKHLTKVPSNVIVVHYAPQADIIARSVVTVNCAGLNTTLDALSCGIPLVLMPLGEDQPGVAARIESAGLGRRLSIRHISSSAIRQAIDVVLTHPAYQANADRFRTTMPRDGAARAAIAVERCLDICSPEARLQ